MIPNGHATFELGEGILVATLRLGLGGWVLGLFGGRRTGLVERRGGTASGVAMVVLVRLVLLLLLLVVTVMAVAIQLPIALLPLDLVVLEGTIVAAARRHRDSGRGLAATGGMVVALMVVRRLSRRAPLHRVGIGVGGMVVRVLILLLVGIEAQAVFIVGMRCHLAGGDGGTLRDSKTHTHSGHSFFFFFSKHKTFCDLFFFRFLARFQSLCLFFNDGTAGLNFYSSFAWLEIWDWRLEFRVEGI